MKVSVPFQESYAPLIDSGKATIDWPAGYAPRAKQSPPERWDSRRWREYVDKHTPLDRAFVTFECPEGDIPGDATVSLVFSEDPLGPLYTSEGDRDPNREVDPEWGAEPDRFGYMQKFYKGVRVRSGPTNWGGNKSFWFVELPDLGVRISSLDRAGSQWHARDVVELRAAIAAAVAARSS